MSDGTQDVGEVQHRKSGPIQNLHDAIGLVEWFASVLKNEAMEQFPTPYYVQVQVSIRPIQGEKDAE